MARFAALGLLGVRAPALEKVYPFTLAQHNGRGARGRGGEDVNALEFIPIQSSVASV
jgi:hypothetical protein